MIAVYLASTDAFHLYYSGLAARLDGANNHTDAILALLPDAAAILAGTHVLRPIEPTNEQLDYLAAECRATWGVNVANRKTEPFGKREWRERMRPIYAAAIRNAGRTG